MLIAYFTQTIGIYSRGSTKTNGVVKDNLVKIKDVKGRIDPAQTNYSYSGDKALYEYTHILFTPYDSEIQENMVAKINDREYNIVSVLDPFSKNHHLEVLLKEKK